MDLLSRYLNVDLLIIFTDRTYSREASGRRAFCSFIRSHRSCIAAGIAVLIAVGLAPLTFINKEVTL